MNLVSNHPKNTNGNFSKVKKLMWMLLMKLKMEIEK